MLLAFLLHYAEHDTFCLVLYNLFFLKPLKFLNITGYIAIYCLYKNKKLGPGITDPNKGSDPIM